MAALLKRRNKFFQQLLKAKRIGSERMVDRSQLASAMLALAFAAVMLVAGQLFIEYRSTSTAVKPVAMKNAAMPL
jgi:hypothetical protein